MKIAIDDTIKIDEALKAVNGTATAFTVTDARRLRQSHAEGSRHHRRRVERHRRHVPSGGTVRECL
jgi:hypothetical protein